MKNKQEIKERERLNQIQGSNLLNMMERKKTPFNLS